jgi:DNA-binding beta-propeller fold protein YncE
VSLSFARTFCLAGLGLAFLVASACGQGSLAAVTALQGHSSPIVSSPNGALLFVVHPDADSVSAIEPATRAIVWQTLLADAPPAKDGSLHYAPSVMPRALVLDPTGKTLYVTGERNGTLGAAPGLADSGPGLVYALDAATGTLVGKSAPLCSEPAGILIDAAGANLFVACSNDDAVVELRATDLSPLGRASCPHKPWALSWAADGETLLATHLLGPGVSTFATSPLTLGSTWTIPEGGLPEGADPSTPNGQVRGIYDVVSRPASSEVWVTHAMLSHTTPEPALAFNTTAFPAIAVLDPNGDMQARLTVSSLPGDGHAFGDIVSGPRSIAFSPDGRYAFVVDANSEDVLVVDANLRAEAALVRPLPGHMPEGIVFSPNGKVYVMERNTEDLAVLDVTLPAASADADAGDVTVGTGLSVVLESTSIPTLSNDPMPADYRLGQQLFHSANSDQLPITQNHWMACATCHIEDRTDAITWKFLAGPRDTPSNAGGVLDTGFLMHTADRRLVSNYWITINEEQGGHFGMNPTQTPLLDAIQTFVNYAIPVPVPPTTDPSLVAQGRGVFGSSGCPTCHSGLLRTDSACGNPALDLSGPEVSVCTKGGVLVHDVGTCNKGPFPDTNHTDMDGHARNPCAYDTPALRGLWDSAPYMHDGSAATLGDAIDIMIVAAGKVGGAKSLTVDQKEALVEYLKSL